MTSFYEGREVWFVTGSQDLYGEETLAQVAQQSQEVVRLLNESDLLPAPIVWKPVLKDSDSIKRAMLEASADDRVLGVIHLKDVVKPGMRERFDEMRRMDMEVAGEFIVMASELMLIKSRMLLPK